MATSSRKHFSQQHWIQYLLPVQTLTEAQNLGRRFQEGGGDAHRQRDAECIAIAGSILDGYPAFLAGDAHAHRAARPFQLLEPEG